MWKSELYLHRHQHTLFNIMSLDELQANAQLTHINGLYYVVKKVKDWEEKIIVRVIGQL